MLNGPAFLAEPEPRLPSPRLTEEDSTSPSPAVSQAISPPLSTATATSVRQPVPINRTPGFLGSTSYAAVFQDSQERIITECYPPLTNATAVTDFEADHADMINEGARVLSRLCDVAVPLAETPNTHKCAEELTVLAPLMVACVTTVKEIIDKLSRSSPAERDFVGLSKEIFHNTSKTYLARDITNPQKMIDFFVTDGLRWEAVGLAASTFGLGSMGGMCRGTNTLPLGPGEGSISRLVLAKAMVTCASTCLNFLDELGLLNDLSIWVVYENALVTSFVYGDSSKYSRPLSLVILGVLRSFSPEPV